MYVCPIMYALSIGASDELQRAICTLLQKKMRLRSPVLTKKLNEDRFIGPMTVLCLAIYTVFQKTKPLNFWQ